MGKLQKQIAAALLFASVMSPIAHAEEYVGVMRIVDDKVVYLGEDESFWGYDEEEESVDEEEEEEEDYYEEEATTEDEGKEDVTEQEKKPEDKKQEPQKKTEEKKQVAVPAAEPKKSEDKKEQSTVVQIPSNVNISFGTPLSSPQSSGVDLILRSGSEYKSIDVEELLVCPDEVVFDGFSFFVTDAEIVGNELQFLAISASDVQTLSAKDDVATRFAFANHDIWVMLAPRAANPKPETQDVKPASTENVAKPDSPTANVDNGSASKPETVKDQKKTPDGNALTNDNDGTDTGIEQEGVDEATGNGERIDVVPVESGENHAYGRGQDETSESVDEES